MTVNFIGFFRNMQRDSRAKINLRQKITLMIFGIALFLVLLETGLQIGGWVLLSLQEYRNRVTLGKKGAYRIMCLGESTTVLGGSKAYPYQLEEVLNRQALGIKFSVVNKGLGGDNTSDILSALEAKVDRYRPDMVIAMMGINDNGPHMRYKEAPGSGRSVFLRYCRTYKLARIAWMHIMAIMRDTAGSRAFIGPGNCYAADEGSLTDYDRYMEAGRLHIKNDEYAEAEDMFERAFELNPADPGPYMRLELCYNKQGKLSDMERVLKKIIEMDPGNYSLYLRLGVFYRTQGDLKGARGILNRAIGLEPDSPYAYIELACCFEGIMARRLMRKAVELDPLNYATYIRAGTLYKQYNDYNGARDMFEKAIALDPDNELGYIWLAVLCKDNGEGELAERYYKAAYQLRNEHYNFMTYRNYHELKRIVDARAIKLV